ncbi:GNAT family N-acetyltransferase [Microbulbifer guangxiensis]|uniref:GNAT family N-acetyltransferase n=1 Tax=Microbulbifer guangxiensis TaxID=2904249 RepID=UPI001F1F7454|nr:GNAT family N-acetyltransferase [Microbulbifer guangxiensis]
MSKQEPQEALTRTVTEKLSNDRVVTIRPMEREDRELESDFITHLSPESRHFRFLGGVGKPSEKLLDALTDIDHDQREAFIALAGDDSREKQVGVSRYAVDADGTAAECAVVVADDWQKAGLGTLLINRLVESARARGLQRLYSIDSAENHKLQEVARNMGWDCKTNPDDHTQVIYTLQLNGA